MLAAGPLHPAHAALVTEGVAGGLDAAPARGLVPRDVKPANILIEQRAAARAVGVLAQIGGSVFAQANDPGQGGLAPVYGLAASLPDRSVIAYFLKGYMDLWYRP